MTHRRRDCDRRLALLLPHEGAQRPPRADFAECARRRLEERPHAVGESHGAAEVLDPVSGVGCLGIRDPCAGHVRDEGDLRTLEIDRPAKALELAQDGIDHRRVCRDANMHARALYTAESK